MSTTKATTKTDGSKQQELIVQRREVIGKRPVKRLRREGLVPGVVYGRETEPVAITVNARELVKFLRARTGEHSLINLRLGNDGGWEKPVLIKTIQHDAVDGHILHIDFHAIVLTERIKVKVPILLKGEAVGVKQDGGILEHFLREVEVECLPTEIPAGVEFDVSALKVGETVHVRDLTPPANTVITSEPEGVITSVLVPREEKPEEAAGVTEPEVIREKKEETETAAAEEGKAERPEAKKETKS